LYANHKTTWAQHMTGAPTCGC